MFERPDAPKFVSEQSLIADLITITKQQEMSPEKSHTEGSDFNYSHLSEEHDIYLSRMKESTNKKIKEEQKLPVNLNFTAEAQQELEQHKKKEEERQVKFQDNVTKISYKEAKEDKRKQKKDYVNPQLLVQSMALRLKNYDMYEHAKRFEEHTVEGMLAEDAEMQTYDMFLQDIQQDVESDHEELP
jgi:hypothetical protein